MIMKTITIVAMLIVTITYGWTAEDVKDDEGRYDHSRPPTATCFKTMDTIWNT